jgi:hypothetical protein
MQLLFFDVEVRVLAGVDQQRLESTREFCHHSFIHDAFTECCSYGAYEFNYAIISTLAADGCSAEANYSRS